MNKLHDENLKQVSGGLNDPEHPLYGLGSWYITYEGGNSCKVGVIKFLGNINGNNMYEVYFTIQINGMGGMSTPAYADVTEKQIEDKVFLHPSDAKKLI